MDWTWENGFRAASDNMLAIGNFIQLCSGNHCVLTELVVIYTEKETRLYTARDNILMWAIQTNGVQSEFTPCLDVLTA